MDYKKIIIDSSVWISAFNKEDSNHKKALAFASSYEEEQWMPDIVFYEVLTVLKNKIKDTSLVDEFVQYATTNGNILIRLFYEYNSEVLKTFIHETSARLSYVDSLLVYLSRDFKILTFDDNLKTQIRNIGGGLVER